MHAMFKFLFLLSFLVLSIEAHTQLLNTTESSFETLAQQDSTKELVQTIYIVGDCGELDNEIKSENYVLDVLGVEISKDTNETSLVFLGDNIYPAGMSEVNSPYRSTAEVILNTQLKLSKEHKGTTYFIPGNHDWNFHKPGGRKAILRQEEYILEYAKKQQQDIKFYPKNACGDPKVVKINKDLVYFFLDSQWWVHDWSGEPDINNNCKVDSREELLVKIDELISKHKNDHIFLFIHHPTFTNGNHGGYFSAKQHIFPLSDYGVWIPIPVLGSAYPFYRQVIGSEQDITHVLNQKLLYTISKMANFYKAKVTFVSGHEHGLQYFDTGDLKYIVSGSGGKVDYLRQGGKASYIHRGRGYVVVKTYTNGEAWAEYFTVNPEKGCQPCLGYRTQLRKPKKGTENTSEDYPSVIQKDTTFVSNPEFGANGFERLFIGRKYRDFWTKELTLPTINLEESHGGLTPIKIGGGLSSNVLRLETKDKRQYSLRSMNKEFNRQIPREFRNLKIIDFAKDMNTSIYPFGTLTLPYLSKAANIYYTSPKLVFLKKQKAMNGYGEYIPEGLYSLEERPSGNWEGYEAFGGSTDIISYNKLIKKLKKKKNHHVDQSWALRSRLFDVFIHDWDRHEDQWRWAKFKKGEKTIYRPIPRDRDWAYFRFDGLIYYLISHIGVNKFQSMDDDMSNIIHQSHNARNFDRSFLNELTWNDWLKEINFLKENISPEVIREAFNNRSVQSSQEYNQEIQTLLIKRLDHLEKASRKYYEFLYKEVEIVGTDHKDHFHINIINADTIEVSHVIPRKKGSSITRYRRKFSANITNEIRIYGLNDDDSFEIEGTENNRTKIRIVGGEDDDIVKNDSPIKPYIYDQTDGISFSGQAYDNTEEDHSVNKYDRLGYRYDFGLPIVYFGRTIDDGWWFGGGYRWTNFGWRKEPYKSLQSMTFSMAPMGSEALQFNYTGVFPELFGSFHFEPTADISFPRYENFFGYGNETINLRKSTQFNWVRIQSASASPMFTRGIPDRFTFGLGPHYETHNIVPVEYRVNDDSSLGVELSDRDRRHYFGLSSGLNAQFKDNLVNPTTGFQFDLNFKFIHEPFKSENVFDFSTSIASYYQLSFAPKLILAHKLGYKQAGGDLMFHQYADLGNSNNLRGFRNERFRGHKAFYHNIDLRLQLKEYENIWLPMDIGLATGYDYGRVWYNGESSGLWHYSLSMGPWFDILDRAVIHPYYSILPGEDPNTFTLRLGFNF